MILIITLKDGNISECGLHIVEDVSEIRNDGFYLFIQGPSDMKIHWSKIVKMEIVK